MITDQIREEVAALGADLFRALEAPDDWLTRVTADYNRRLAAASADEPPPCNPLLCSILFDRFKADPTRTNSIHQLLNYYRSLPEFSKRSWAEKRARILGDDFGTFHTTLIEISLHHTLASMPELKVRFLDPHPGGRKRPDYELRVRGHAVQAELKSILSEQVRMPAGSHFGGGLDPVIARAIWRRLTQPIRERQVDRTSAAAVFVDITTCDELFVSLCLSSTFPASLLKLHGAELLDRLSSAGQARVPNTVSLFVCGFDPSTLGAVFISPVALPNDNSI